MSKQISKRAEQRRRNQRKVPAWPFLAGMGLLVVALMLMPSGESASSPTEELSSAPAVVNYPAPALSLESLGGGTEDLTDYHGKVVLVNNWATWCPPCKAELPTLVGYYTDHAEEGFTIIGVDAGEPANVVQAFVKQAQISYPIWLDATNQFGKAFKVNSLPNSFVIDRNGMVRLAWVGQVSRDTLEKYVTPLLAEE